MIRCALVCQSKEIVYNCHLIIICQHFQVYLNISTIAICLRLVACVMHFCRARDLICGLCFYKWQSQKHVNRFEMHAQRCIWLRKLDCRTLTPCACYQSFSASLKSLFCLPQLLFSLWKLFSCLVQVISRSNTCLLLIKLHCKNKINTFRGICFCICARLTRELDRHDFGFKTS